MDIDRDIQVATRQRHIGIVDDERPVREALARLLRASGHTVERFASGSEFLQSLAQRPPDCLLLDLNMPGMSGYEVLEQLAHLPRSLAVVVITADCEPHVLARAKSLGAHAVLCKPVDETSLFDAIESALDPHSSERV